MKRRIRPLELGELSAVEAGTWMEVDLVHNCQEYAQRWPASRLAGVIERDVAERERRRRLAQANRNESLRHAATAGAGTSSATTTVHNNIAPARKASAAASSNPCNAAEPRRASTAPACFTFVRASSKLACSAALASAARGVSGRCRWRRKPAATLSSAEA